MLYKQKDLITYTRSTSFSYQKRELMMEVIEIVSKCASTYMVMEPKMFWYSVCLVRERDFETLPSAGVDVSKGWDTSH